MLNQEQVAAYLSRIGVTGTLNVNLDTLNQLLFAHLTRVPFDSLDVWGGGLCPSLDTTDLYKKIVVQKRGGYCFELNTLFRLLLNSLGFDAYQVVACLLNEDYTPHPPAHNVIICRIQDRKYLLDVGFGGPVPYEAVELKPGQYGKFLLRRNKDLFILERVDKDGIRPFIQFRDIPAVMTDLEPLNFYISQNPTSHFRHIIHLNQRNPDGSTFVVEGDEFRIYKNGEVTIQRLEEIDQLETVLQTYYGVDPSTCILRETI